MLTDRLVKALADFEAYWAGEMPFDKAAEAKARNELLDAWREYTLIPEPARDGRTLRDEMAMGSTGWWLLLKNRKHHYYDTMRDGSPNVDEIAGFTYSPAELLAWIRTGALPASTDAMLAARAVAGEGRK